MTKEKICREYRRDHGYAIQLLDQLINDKYQQSMVKGAANEVEAMRRLEQFQAPANKSHERPDGVDAWYPYDTMLFGIQFKPAYSDGNKITVPCTKQDPGLRMLLDGTKVKAHRYPFGGPAKKSFDALVVSNPDLPNAVYACVEWELSSDNECALLISGIQTVNEKWYRIESAEDWNRFLAYLARTNTLTRYNHIYNPLAPRLRPKSSELPL